MGLEPTTPCLQSRCSSQLSYVPARNTSCYGVRLERSPLRTLSAVLRELIEPLWLPIFVLVAVWVMAWRSGLTKWSRIAGTAALAAMWLMSTPLAAFVLERPLATESQVDANWSPDFIYVLAGGYDIGDSEEQDATVSRRRAA